MAQERVEVYPGEWIVFEPQVMNGEAGTDPQWDLFKVRAYLESSPNVEWNAYRFRRDNYWDCPVYDLNYDGDTAKEAILQAVKATL